jgi:hypothetical protein
MEDQKNRDNLDDIKILLKNSEIENQKIEEKKKNSVVYLSQIKKGVLVFSVVHLLFEICMSVVTNNSLNFWPSIFVNYFIAVWYAKEKLSKNKLTNDINFFNYGIKISFIIFLIRLVLGFALSFYINNKLNNI